MKRINHFWYVTLQSVARFGMFFWHPVFRPKGAELVPEGPCVIASNHSGMADPLWLLFSMRLQVPPRIMAKEAVMKVPILGPFLRWVGLIGVRRGENDITAIKESLRVLKNGEKLLIYPEGTRVKQGCRLEAKTGAVMLAMRAGVPVLPVWVQPRRAPFVPVHTVIGAPYMPQCDGKPTAEDLRRLSDELMNGIYALGETV